MGKADSTIKLCGDIYHHNLYMGGCLFSLVKTLLSELGLTENESTVYEMLLRDGPSLAGKITQKTGIHRRNVYDCLERLNKKGLVGFVKENNRKCTR